MRFALVTLLCCAVVTALTGEETPEKWGGPRSGDKISYGGHNFDNGDGGDIGDIGVGVGGGGSGGGCNTAACDAKCRKQGHPSGYCDNGSGSPNLPGLNLGQTTP
ncbi:hypothetical protein N7481_010383 [Penicillium waksmanii]|uniref:uncharacterized protein n=1 Tax=Penicillium waksmanii TaxID=69791 RepID=UPI002547DE85|nr:uncharacterized protein N7481_010383 [Penicillium waksmanii]KAJ5973173.1 hypothetical protein N7481_010383 [Penicillium waksmanii]